MTRLVIRHGTVLDQQGERRADVAIADGRIVGVGTDLPAEDDDRVLDAAGSHVTPGFVDLHVHLREPGREEAETIETGSRAAALGGFTAVVAMPNTEPPQDSLPTIEFVRAVAEGDLVALHTHQTWPGGDEYVTMDFFRFDADGKIVEHWDAIQIVPPETKSGNSMY